MTIELSSSQRRALRAAAHRLNPVVSISQQGLSEGVLAEIERSLASHSLIKIRVYGAERADREQLLSKVCEALKAAPVQHIGNILVIWRESLEPPAAAPAKPVKRLSRVASTARKAERVDGKESRKTGVRRAVRSR